MKRGLRVLSLGLLAAAVWSVPALALTVPPKPASGAVSDQAHVLSDAQVTSLNAKLDAARAATGNQVGVLTVQSLDGNDIADYSLQVARTWGIGEKAKDNGVLLIVATGDHRVRIEVGYGLEGALTDARSGQIIRNRITPAFKAGDYNGGINSGVDGILLAIKGEVDPQRNVPASGSSSGLFQILFPALFVVPVWLGSILGRSKSWWAGGVIGGAAGLVGGLVLATATVAIVSAGLLAVVGLVFDYLVSKNYHSRRGSGVAPSWWAGGGGFGGGGGNDSGGFGGGGFGGGGASGGW